MLVEDLLKVIEGLAPAHLAQSWDNSGLQVGDTSVPVGRVMASLELTEGVLAEAIAGDCGVILTHHPLLFSAVRSLVESQPNERLLRRIVENRLNVISCHTNLDAARGGLADIAAEAIGLRNARPLECIAAGWVKLVGFMPESAVDAVAEAVFKAGAGGVGDYSECAYSSTGTGWFTPGRGAKPTVGEVGRAERAEEVRWETVLPKHRLAAVVTAFTSVHPYEEPAFDLIPVEDVFPNVGLGRVGLLSADTRLGELVDRVGDIFGVEPVVGGVLADRVLKKAAVMPGSGRGMVDVACGKCEVLITGELSYHDAELAEGQGLTLIDVPHGEVEWWTFKRWIGRLSEALEGEGVEVEVSKQWRSPWRRRSELRPGLEEER